MRFRRLVREALATIPEDLMARVHNVTFVIERRPSATERKLARTPQGELLLGLYTGIPLTKRGDHYNLVLPDRIVIFQEPIEQLCATDEDVRQEVHRTVVHELGHYFGIDDERLHELGAG